MSALERFQGCLLAGAVGDALGAPVEFMKRGAILRAFGPHGITRYEQLTEMTEKDLLAIHGVGAKAIRILGEGLRARGLSFKDG